MDEFTSRNTALATVSAITIIVALMAGYLPRAAQLQPQTSVAFIGNSIMFCNDLPRFFQALSSGNDNHDETSTSMIQNSCLHGSLSFKTIIQKGNGMDDATKFRTANACIHGYRQTGTKNTANSNDNNNNNTVCYMYDLGACTVRQLLFGDDENLSPYNENEFYTNNDGLNPCFRQQDNADTATYYEYLQDTYRPPKWDFVVMNDNTVYPGDYQRRQKSLSVLQDKYASMFLELGSSSTPVFLVTHGYERHDTSVFTRLGNVSVFTSRIHYGYKLYADELAVNLPQNQTPILAPVGLAFLTLYEEDYNLWKKLFFYDGYHPSAHGTYLMGCVLYASLFGRMPSTEYAFPLAGIQQLWSKARKMQLLVDDEKYPTLPIPTVDEAAYLFKVAKRVVLQGHVPKSLLTHAQVEALEAEEMADESSSSTSSYG